MTAKDETTTIFSAAGDAAEALRYFDGRVSNGFGELADPSLARRQLREASRAILAALTALDRADKAGWTDRDD